MIKPGFYPDMPAPEYHALKALAASGVDTLVNECPWKMWQASPWNPKFEPQNKREFDIGTAAHLAVLEPAQFDARTVKVPHASYRTNEARDMRDQAYANDRVPLRPEDMGIVGGMARAIFEQARSYFVDGHAESSLVWEWDEVLCKARPDYLIRDERALIVDLKTTSTSNPKVIARKAFAEGWHVRACWYKEAVSSISPRVFRYIFVVIETAPPHLIQIFELDDRALAWGEQLVRRGLRLFRDCMERGEWPAYSEGVQTLSLPVWAEYQLADRSEAGEFSDKMLPGEAIEAERERCARLHESINPASDDERIRKIPGAGAMGAVIEYRDMIRRQP